MVGSSLRPPVKQMTAILFDYVQRAAEAFVAANRTSDPELSARLRQTAYGFLDLLNESEEELRRSSPSLDGSVALWGDVLPKSVGPLRNEAAPRRLSIAATAGDADGPEQA